MPDIHEGGCLCGKVRYRVLGDPRHSGVCHCAFCKRRTGSAFGISVYFDEAAVQITSGLLKIYEYRSDESNRWIRADLAELWNDRNGDSGVGPRRNVITGGTFDDPNWIKPQGHGWTRSALHWMVFAADVPIFKTTRAAG